MRVESGDGTTKATVPRRLIEVDLPIRRISSQARREKSIRHGHISTLHIWWARRPLAACRSVVLGGLLPDPADDDCPQSFREGALRALGPLPGKMRPKSDRLELRAALLDFIADFSDWDRCADPTYLKAARDLVAAAYPGGPPTVADPFAGGGAIPFEALRVGAECWANEINPVAQTLLRAELADIPGHAERLLEPLKGALAELKKRLAPELEGYYATGEDRLSIGYLWARTAQCEGPGCGLTIPLIRDFRLVRRPGHEVGVRLAITDHACNVELVTGALASGIRGRTVVNGSLVCPSCGFTTRNAALQAQGRRGQMGVRGLAVIGSAQDGRSYRAFSSSDYESVAAATNRLKKGFDDELALIRSCPISPIRPSPRSRGVSAVTRYGVGDFSHLMLPRQLLSLLVICRELSHLLDNQDEEPSLRRLMALVVGRVADRMTMSTRLNAVRETFEGAFGGKAVAWVWDFAEVNPLSDSGGGLSSAADWVSAVIANIDRSIRTTATVTGADARRLPIPDRSVDAVITDPPYSDQIPYADLSEYFHLWQVLCGVESADFRQAKQQEIVVNAADPGPGGMVKTTAYYQDSMTSALGEARRILADDGIGIVVFADKTTAGWEALLNSVVKAGWTVTASWPIDTEMGGRLRGRDTAALASSVHLVCRPRPASAGIGDWNSVLRELQPRVDAWMRRLAQEGVVGADAIFACLGPAIELYSRYDRVETVAGDLVPLGGRSGTGDDYLSQVWAAVARAALRTIFEEAEASGFEADGRLAAVWLWTLGAGQLAANGEAAEDAEDDEDEEQELGSKPKVGGFILPYDTARKLAQPLGADLSVLGGRPGAAFEVKGATARMLPLAERRAYLFDSDNGAPASSDRRNAQASFFDNDLAPPSFGGVKLGTTTLDRVHQAMLLFGEDRADALRRLLVEDGAGDDSRFWRLADALSKLYPTTSPEKRWVDGVLARKRMLNL